MKRLLLVLNFLMFANFAQAQESIAPSSWVNQRGSVMHVNFQNPINNGIFGYYVNNAPNYPHCNGVPYFLSGQSNGRTVTFTVRWSGPFVEDCKSTTVWSGRIRGSLLNTSWVLKTDSGQTIRGKDFFTRR